MGTWSVVIPEAVTNMVLNPSAETTGNFAAYNTGTIAQSTTYQFRGLYSYHVTSAATTQGASFTLSALANATHYVTMEVRGTLPATWQWSLDGTNWTAPTAISTKHSGWTLYGASFPAAQANGSTTLYVRQSGAGSGDYYLDALQVEQADHWTTYCDGSQPGCTWSGAAHASTSSRTAQRREGGRVRDLMVDYGVSGITAMLGTGMPPVHLNLLDQSFLPGSLYQSTKVQAREFSLVLGIKATSLADLHATRKKLVDAFKDDAVSPSQPVRLRYTGATQEVQIGAYYLGGLEIDLPGNVGSFERIPVKLLATDPFWYELAEQAISLTVSLSVSNANYIIRRVAGVWSAMGTGMNGTVNAIVVAPDHSVYATGAFTLAGGVTNTAYIARWVNGAWTALGTGLNGVGNSLCLDASGNLYVGGAFTTANGVSCSRIAKWNGSTFVALGTGGADGTVYSIAIGQDGLVYAGGSFTGMGGVGGTARIAKWDGSAWTALGSGALDNAVVCLAIAKDGGLYAGGQFTQMGGVANTSRIAKWSGSAWISISSGITGVTPEVDGATVGPDGRLYVTGLFTGIGGVTASNVAVWNGTYWAALGTGLNQASATMVFTPDGLLYVGGAFTTAGGLSLASRVAIWDGTQWQHFGIVLPGSPTVYAIARDGQDLYLGYNATGTATAAVSNATTNNGSRTTYPKIVLKRSGGTSLTAQWIKNETTGKTLLLNYSLLDGETITIDLTPGAKKVTSDYFGDILGRTALPSGDFTAFGLLPGSNTLTVLATSAGSPTITCFLLAPLTHHSPDGIS